MIKSKAEAIHIKRTLCYGIVLGDFLIRVKQRRLAWHLRKDDTIYTVKQYT